MFGELLRTSKWHSAECKPLQGTGWHTGLKFLDLSESLSSSAKKINSFSLSPRIPLLALSDYVCANPP